MESRFRSTMSQSRLNWCVVLNVHREKTDELPMIHLLNEFIGRCGTRMCTFGLNYFVICFAKNFFVGGGGWVGGKNSGGGGFSPPVSTGLL